MFVCDEWLAVLPYAAQAVDMDRYLRLWHPSPHGMILQVAALLPCGSTCQYSQSLFSVRVSDIEGVQVHTVAKLLVFSRGYAQTYQGQFASWKSPYKPL